MTSHPAIRPSWVVQMIAFGLTFVSISGFIRLANLYYVLLGLFALTIFLNKNGRIRFGQLWIVVFLVACLISLVVNNPPPFFNAWKRLALYTLILLIVSPVFNSRGIGILRGQLLEGILTASIILSVGSFFAYFLGINLFDRGDGYLDIGAGSFSGLMNHSIVLGHFSGLSTAYMFSLLLDKNGRTRLLFIILTLLCFGACLLSASRNGIFSCLSACFIAVICHYRKSISKAILIVFTIVLIGIFSFPLWGGLTDFLVEKNERNIEESGSILFSRERKFNARIQEFKSSPIFGIGYCTVDPSLDRVNYSNGQIEPGSSWLAIASMTGILGLIPFICICFEAIKRSLKKQRHAQSCIEITLLGYYFLHMMSEGYLLAPRSFLSLVFWLIISTSYSNLSSLSTTPR